MLTPTLSRLGLALLISFAIPMTPSVAEDEEQSLMDSLDAADSEAPAETEQSVDEFAADMPAEDSEPQARNGAEDEMEMEMEGEENPFSEEVESEGEAESETPFEDAPAEDAEASAPEEESGESESAVSSVPRRIKYTRGAVPERLNLLLGVDMIKATALSVSPNVELDYALTVDTAVGVSAGLMRVETSSEIIRGFALLGTVAHYPRGVYGGPLFQVAAGIKKFSSSLDLGTGIAFQGSIGYRWHSSVNSGSFGVAVGPDVTRWNEETEIALLIRIHLGIDFAIGDVFF